MTVAREYQVALEVIQTGDPSVREYQVALEVLSQIPPNARIYQTALEALRPNSGVLQATRTQVFTGS
jgi:hypothetical protein